MEDLAIVWLRRDLRLYDHKPFNFSLKHKSFLPVFIFDSTILERFSNPHDRRLTFLANALCLMMNKLEVLVLYGDPVKIIPKLNDITNATKIYAGKDFEPDSIERDSKIAKATQNLELLDDHIILNPEDVKKDDGNPFKVFTPFSKVWRKKAAEISHDNYEVDTSKALKNLKDIKEKLRDAGIKVVNTKSTKSMLDDIGYKEFDETIWLPEKGRERLHEWCDNRINDYKNTRDFMGIDGTSRLSPYIRFGVISIRECYNLASNHHGAGSETWINELIWREFYIAVLYHFPQSQNLELQEQYRGIPWNHNQKHIEAWMEGKTGYPIVDAAMRQLKEVGWMHNRCRMITASFFCKHLFADWRIGEEYFAQYLMDYEAASNIGGWQWSSSTGTDAQPYFRIFNPFLQSMKFDEKGDYLRTYLPELRNYKGQNIHDPQKDGLMNKYYPMIVNHDTARKDAIEKFKEHKG